MNPEGYALAIEKAVEQIQGVDFERQCGRCGATYNKTDSSAVIQFFGRDYRITKSGDMTRMGDTIPSFPSENRVMSPEVPVVEKLIILHYMVRSDGTKPSGNMVTFREIPEGAFYFHSFNDRVLKPFLTSFGNAPEKLREKGHALGWGEGGIGDISLQTNALPLVPIRFVLWLGDEELSPEASILFDSSASQHLHTEDIALLGEQALGRLI